MKKNGFTLAEVLITLGIIGVVAAMTIPTLVANYQKKVLVAKLQQTISLVSNAAKLLMAEEQTFNLNQTYLYQSENLTKEDFENSVGKFLKTYLKVVKTCNIFDNNLSDCINEDYKLLDGQDGAAYIGVWTYYCGLLNNGAAVCIYPSNQYMPITLNIDVNGKSGPNVWGRDAFSLSMNYSGAIAETFNKDQNSIDARKPEQCGVFGDLTTYAGGCYNKIVQDGWKMDY